jgi:hypothetical protein
MERSTSRCSLGTRFDGPPARRRSAFSSTGAENSLWTSIHAEGPLHVAGSAQPDGRHAVQTTDKTRDDTQLSQGDRCPTMHRRRPGIFVNRPTERAGWRTKRPRPTLPTDCGATHASWTRRLGNSRSRLWPMLLNSNRPAATLDTRQIRRRSPTKSGDQPGRNSRPTGAIDVRCTCDREPSLLRIPPRNTGSNLRAEVARILMLIWTASSLPLPKGLAHPHERARGSLVRKTRNVARSR